MIRDTEPRTQSEEDLIYELKTSVDRISDPKFYLQHPDRKYVCHEELVLDLGGFFRPELNTNEKLQGYVGDCYRNSIVAIIDYRLEGDSIHYVEGYALGMMPYIHAWISTDESRSYEITWPELGHSYFGIPLLRLFVATKVLETKKHGVFANDFLNKMILLENGIPDSDILWE